MTWGLLFVALFIAAPRGFQLEAGWVPLHTILEVLSVVVSATIFLIGRNSLFLSSSACGMYVGGMFLLAGVLDIAHLLSFPGMPDWVTPNQDTKSITFWLMARCCATLGLILSIMLNWNTSVRPSVRWTGMLIPLLLSGGLIFAGLFVSHAYPGLFWGKGGLTELKIWAEYLLIVGLVIAVVLEIRRPADRAPYPRVGMLSALLTLLVSEWCFVGYVKSNDALIILGHVYKVIGYFLLYRCLVRGIIRIPYSKLDSAMLEATERRQEMEGIFLSAPDGVVLVASDGSIRKVNPRFTELTGYTESDVKGLSIDIMLPERFRAGHRHHVAHFMAAPKTRAMATGRDLNARRRDGTEFPVDISLSSLKVEGENCVIATIRDVTERAAMIQELRESEQRVRGFLDNSIDWVWETDPVGMISYSSQRVQELLGYEASKVVGKTLNHFMTEADARHMGSILREIIVRREPMIHIDHHNRTSSGEVRVMETNARPYFDKEGGFKGYRGVTRDVTRQQDLQAALKKSEQVFRHAFDDFPRGMMFIDCTGQILRVNDFLGQLLGYEMGRLETKSISSLFPMDVRWEISQEILALCEGRKSLYSTETKMLGQSGEMCHVRITTSIVDLSDGAVGPLLMMVSDISAEKEAAAHNKRLLAILERMGDAVAVADRSGRLLYLNPFARHMLGVDLNADVAGEMIQQYHPEHVAKFIMSHALRQAEKSGVWEGEVVWRSRSGEEILTWQVLMVHRDASGETEYWTVVARDIRERKLMEDRLSFQATHDALTGLPNRLLLRDRLQQSIISAKRERKLLAVIFIDLDNFKRINDTLGHSVGDQVLIEVANGLRECLRGSDTLARQGGDEFIVLLPGLNTVNDVVGIVEKIVATLAQCMIIDGREICLSASLGISVYPFDHDNGDELLRKADVAMYRAKEQGRNGYQFYTSDMDERFNQELQLEIELRHAIGNNELVLFYQPKIALDSEETVGFEALVRWMHPTRGMVPPGDFIPVAERSMLISHLGEWVLREACRQIRQWIDDGKAVVPVAVNVSAQQFEYMDIARFIRQVLDEAGIEGSMLELEITEGVLMRDPVATTRALAQIKALGVNIAVDDFGTGYSSLGYLKHFPVDVLKIDRSFVSEIPTNADDAAIVRAIISMAHNLDITVVAEGVETRSQLDYLRECECDFVQGFLFGKPQPPANVVLLPAGQISPL